jgi:regulator of sigma E protease
MIPHDVMTEKVLIKDVAADSPAQVAGIQAGDRIMEINGHQIKNRGELSYQIQLNLGNDITMVVQKPDATKTMALNPAGRRLRGRAPQG